MQTPRELRSVAASTKDVRIARQQVDDEEEIVIDFGPGIEATLDVVGDTAIVVAGDDQYEFEIPPDASEVSSNDGMVRIRG